MATRTLLTQQDIIRDILLQDDGYDPSDDIDPYGSVAVNSRRASVSRWQADLPPSEYYILSESRTACCCFHVKCCATLILAFSVLFWIGKYIANSTDGEIQIIFEGLGYGRWYGHADVKVVISIVQAVALVCFAAALIISNRWLLIPFLIYQSVLITVQSGILFSYMLVTASGNLRFFEKPAEKIIRLFWDAFNNKEMADRVIVQGDIVIGLHVVILFLFLLMINSFLLSITEQLFKYFRLKTYYRRLYA